MERKHPACVSAKHEIWLTKYSCLGTQKCPRKQDAYAPVPGQLNAIIRPMKRIYAHSLAVVFLPVLFAIGIFGQTECLENAKSVKPILSETARNVYTSKLREAQIVFDKSSNDSDSTIWFGRRHAYLGNYKKAIEIYAEGIQKYPNDARFYRHRGHRLITLRCFDDAIKDFEKAAKLIKGKPDEIEPDGLPNARNIPTSTLQSNIWYHLGLAYYLKGDFKRAAKAYKKCLNVSKNPDMLVATMNWRYISLGRAGKAEKAKKELRRIKDGLDIIENDSYYKLIKVYQGKISADDLLKEIVSDTNNLGNASIGYGLGNWFLMNGKKEKAFEAFRKITNGNQWSSFGYIAAEAEQKR